MSKKIFINNLNTYVSKQLLDTLRNDQVGEDGEAAGDSNVIFGTFIDKDSSEKPDGVKKMLKRSKPRLAMKYLSECDLIVYDLHSGKPDDVRLALDALNKHKNPEEEKVLILISSLMAWQGTPRKQEEIKSAEQLAEEAEAAANAKPEGEEGEEGAEKPPSEAAPSEKDEDDEEGAEQAEEEQEEEVIPDKIRKRYKHLAFSELDYKMRNPIEEYQQIKQIEEEVIAFNREGIKTYVISAGILYGNGEAIFNSHFKKAWLQDPVRLPYIGDGNNFLPTIHVKDLAGMVKQVYEKKPERKYIFAVDNNKKPTQKRIINSISQGIGTGLVESVDIPEVFKKAHPKITAIQLDLDWKKSLLLDLKVTPSSLFIKPSSGDAEKVDEDGEGDEGGGDIIEMEWHCKKGLPENIQVVKKEFEKQHKHRPMKMLINGPPCSGKSFFGQQLAEHFNVPHIHLEKLISDLESWDQENEDKWTKRNNERQVKIDAIKAERAAEKERLRLEAEALKAENGEEDEDEAAEKEGDSGGEEKKEEVKAEGEGEGEEKEEKPVEVEEPIIVPMDGDSEDEFQPIEIKEEVKQFKKENPEGTRLPETIVSKMVRWRLFRNDCQNRGYVLDGFPRNFHQANEVFVVTPPMPPKTFNEDGEEEPIDEEILKGLKPTLVKEIYPESVISLNATKQFLMKRSKMIQKSQMEGAMKWKLERMASKLVNHTEQNSIDLFKQDNCLGNCTYPTTKFFQDNKTELFEIQASGNKYEMFESMRIYVERFGRPYNYLKSMVQLNDERETALVEEESTTKGEKEAKENEDAASIEAQKIALEKKAEARLACVREHMKELEAADELNMRQYGMKYIIPLLTEGMIDVWKVGPLDPVDYLAECIFKKSGEGN